MTVDTSLRPDRGNLQHAPPPEIAQRPPVHAYEVSALEQLVALHGEDLQRLAASLLPANGAIDPEDVVQEALLYACEQRYGATVNAASLLALTQIAVKSAADQARQDIDTEQAPLQDCAESLVATPDPIWLAEWRVVLTAMAKRLGNELRAKTMLALILGFERDDLEEIWRLSMFAAQNHRTQAIAAARTTLRRHGTSGNE